MKGVLVYQKPEVQRFGALRDLTLIGPGPDGDGGLWGIGWTDGSTITTRS